MSYTELSNTTRTARKVHTCIWCPENIVIGEKYKHVVSIYDGEWQHHSFHTECLSVCQQVAAEDGGVCEIDAHQCQRGKPDEITREYLAEMKSRGA